MEELVLIKKKGFTLIEIVAVMAILTIIFSISVPYVYSLNKIEEDTKEEMMTIKIYDLLTYSKEYCLINRKNGRIRFDRENDKIRFLIGEASVHEVNYESKYDVYFKKSSNEEDLKVSDRGVLESGNVEILKNGNEFKKTTISIGVDYIDIKQ